MTEQYPPLPPIQTSTSISMVILAAKNSGSIYADAALAELSKLTGKPLEFERNTTGKRFFMIARS